MINRLKNKFIWEGWYPLPKAAGKKSVVMYHGIDKNENMLYNARFFGINSFVDQINFFTEHYNIVNLKDFFEEQNLSSTKLNIAITFDDGYLNNLLYAAPILKKFNIPATVFVTGYGKKDDILWADLLDVFCEHLPTKIEFKSHSFYKNKEGKHFDLKLFFNHNEIAGSNSYVEFKKWVLDYVPNGLGEAHLFNYWKLMTDKEIIKLDSYDNIEIGSHGFYHNNLGNISFTNALAELQMSKEYLENLLQKDVYNLAYPDGSYTENLRDEALNLGFKHQCAVDYLFDSDMNCPHIYNRLGLYPISSLPFIDYSLRKFSTI